MLRREFCNFAVFSVTIHLLQVFCLCTNQNFASESGRETDSYNKLKLPVMFLYTKYRAEMRKLVNFFI
jgi:hypothetical protein